MDIATDLANDLLRCNVWEPHNLNLPCADKFKILTPSLLDKENHFKQENEADVLVPVDLDVKVNEFIDVSILVGLYEKYKWLILASYVPLSLHTMARPIPKNCSQARISGVQQDMGRGTTRKNMGRPWLGPRHQKTRSETSGRQVKILAKRHHKYA